jgi:hypothetical protein
MGVQARSVHNRIAVYKQGYALVLDFVGAEMVPRRRKHVHDFGEQRLENLHNSRARDIDLCARCARFSVVGSERRNSFDESRRVAWEVDLSHDANAQRTCLDLKGLDLGSVER